MPSMEGRKLPDTNVFDGRQEIVNLLLPTLLFRRFLRFLFLFTLLYTLGVKKYRLFKKFPSLKRQPIWQEERDGGYAGRNEIIFCIYILDIYYSLNSIIHWIDLKLGP